MASKLLKDLSPRCRPMADRFLALLVEARIPVIIVETRRTEAEHAANLAKGVSWTKHSKHIDGDAIDIALYDEYRLDGKDSVEWDSSHPMWERVGLIGESVGFLWGGRWKQRDLGHFEVK